MQSIIILQFLFSCRLILASMSTRKDPSSRQVYSPCSCSRSRSCRSLILWYSLNSTRGGPSCCFYRSWTLCYSPNSPRGGIRCCYWCSWILCYSPGSPRGGLRCCSWILCYLPGSCFCQRYFWSFLIASRFC